MSRQETDRAWRRERAAAGLCGTCHDPGAWTEDGNVTCKACIERAYRNLKSSRIEKRCGRVCRVCNVRPPANGRATCGTRACRGDEAGGNFKTPTDAELNPACPRCYLRHGGDCILPDACSMLRQPG